MITTHFISAVFVLAILQQLEETDEKFVHCLVLCHTRELAFQISNEFNRFSKHLPHAKCAVFYGGVSIAKDREVLSSRGDRFPNIVVGTPGRILQVLFMFEALSAVPLSQLANTDVLKLNRVRYFVLDECDKVLEALDMRRDVQEIFLKTPRNKQVCMYKECPNAFLLTLVQVMMYSATMPKDVRETAKKFMVKVFFSQCHTFGINWNFTNFPF